MTYKKDQSLQFRVSTRDKEIIEYGASLRGIGVSDYVRTLAVEAAKKELSQFSDSEEITLSSEGWERLSVILEEPTQPNPRLKRAFKKWAAIQQSN